MKKIIITLLFLAGVAHAQQTPPYTAISSSPYYWKLPGAFDYLSLPRGCDTATAWHPVQTRRAGAIFVDTCLAKTFIWYGYWKEVGSTGVSGLFGRTDSRNNTGAGLSFSNAGQDYSIDSIGIETRNYVEASGRTGSLYVNGNTFGYESTTGSVPTGIFADGGTGIQIYHTRNSDNMSVSFTISDDINFKMQYGGPYSLKASSLEPSMRFLARDSVTGIIYDYTGSLSGGTSNTNAGSGYRWLKPAGQEIKTAFAGYGMLIDSSSNTDGLTLKADTATLFPAVRATITSGFIPSVTVSSSTSLSLTNTGSVEKTYVYTGSSNATWTLPAIGTTGQKIRIKNRGTGELTVQRAGSNQIYSNGTFTELILLTGDSETLQDDGTYWITI